MFMLAILADIINRTYDILSAAALSAVSILVENPYYIYDGGFLLSFGAIIAIAVVYPVLEKLLTIDNRRINKMKRAKGLRHSKAINKSRGMEWGYRLVQFIDNTRKSLCVSTSITVVTLPVIASYFNQISVYSIFLNLIVIPLMSIVLGSSFVGMGIGMLGKLESSYMGLMTTGFTWLSSKTLKITSVIIGLYKSLAQETTGFAGNLLVIGKPSLWQYILWFVLLGLGVCIGEQFTCKKHVDLLGRDNLSQIRENVIYRKNKITLSGKWISVYVKVAKNKALSKIIPLAIICMACVVLFYQPRESFEIRNIYVGQGDCTLITGKGLPVMLIDGGSSDRKNVGKNMILPVLKSNGINEVDYCFLTHMDKDHVSGVFEIIEDGGCGVKIKNLVVSESYYRFFIEMLKEKSYGTDVNNIDNQKKWTDSGDDKSGKDVEKSYENLLAEIIKEKKVGIITIKEDDEIVCKNMRIDCISPSRFNEYVGNDSSIVLKIEYQGKNNETFRALFTGDISSTVEDKLIDKIANVTYLKIAHHGSRFSSSSEFLEKTKPQIAVISAGVNNSYGHPHEETLERIKEHAMLARLYRTDECGQVTVKMNKGRVIVKRFMDIYSDDY